MDAVRRYWRMLSGGKSYGACALGFALGAADLFDVIPISDTLYGLVGEEHAGRIMLVAPIGFGLLRMYAGRDHDPVRGEVDDAHNEGEPF